MVPLFSATVRDGSLSIEERKAFRTYLSKLVGQRVSVSVRKWSDVRSRAENAYYWSVVVKMVSDEMGVTPDDAHEFLKSLFLKKGIEHKGKRWEITRSTASLSVAEFEDYAEKCRMWAASELGCAIPLPNEVLDE